MENNTFVQGSTIQVPGLASAVTPVVITPPAGPVDAKPRRMRQKSAAQLGPKEFCWGTGRRKSSVARVRMRPGSGKILINDREMTNFFPRLKDQNDVLAPLRATNSVEKWDVFVNVKGGGMTGQSGATLLGVARALCAADPDTFETLRDKDFLTRDSREVERKKYGHRKARRSFQFSKR